MVRGIPTAGGGGRLKPAPPMDHQPQPQYSDNMHMTLPRLVNRLRCFVAWFDASECEILVDGKPIKSFEHKLEPALPPAGFERRMLTLNITTEPSTTGVDAGDSSFEAAADARWWENWKNNPEKLSIHDRPPVNVLPPSVR